MSPYSKNIMPCSSAPAICIVDANRLVTPAPWTDGRETRVPLRTEESSFYRRPMSDSEWQEITALLKSRIALISQRTISLLSGRILEALEWLDPVMKGYCEITCPNCDDPCCTAKNIFYNRADLLFLIASGITAPSGQTRNHPFEPCRYLTPKGCRLHRIARPYVCVWYLCEAQIDLFREESASVQRRYIKHLEQLRLARLELESLYENLSPIEFQSGERKAKEDFSALG
jgi:hypothetical protein